MEILKHGLNYLYMKWKLKKKMLLPFFFFIRKICSLFFGKTCVSQLLSITHTKKKHFFNLKCRYVMPLLLSFMNVFFFIAHAKQPKTGYKIIVWMNFDG